MIKRYDAYHTFGEMSESIDGAWIKYSDYKDLEYYNTNAVNQFISIQNECDDLKRKLALLTEGIPTKVEIEQYMDIMNAMMKSEIARPRWHPVYTWLRRISEVQNVDR